MNESNPDVTAIHKKLLLYCDLGNLTEFLFNVAIACQSIIAIFAAYLSESDDSFCNVVVAVLSVLILVCTQISDHFSVIASRQYTTLHSYLPSICSIPHPYPFISPAWSRSKRPLVDMTHTEQRISLQNRGSVSNEAMVLSDKGRQLLQSIESNVMHTFARQRCLRCISKVTCTARLTLMIISAVSSVIYVTFLHVACVNVIALACTSLIAPILRFEDYITKEISENQERTARMREFVNKAIYGTTET